VITLTAQQYLEGILSKYNLKDKDIKMIKDHRSIVEHSLKQAYTNKIDTFYYSGSYGKGTAVNLKYDLDLCIYFKNDAFSTLHEMYLDVYKCLNYMSEDFEYILGEGYVVTKQNVSIGLRGYLDADIVPARIINEKSKDANLYVSENGEHIKTNIPLHIEYVNKSKCRPIIKLMKVWKYQHKIHYKSFALELLTIRALKDYNNPDYGKQVWHVLEYIRDHVESIKLVDPANSNNIVSNLIIQSDKINMKNQAKSSLQKQYWKDIIW
jgi:hypothetical protein